MYYFYMGSELLPIPPEKFSLKIKNANKTLTLINEGEINILREAGLTDLEFKVLIPAIEYSFATYEGGFKPPAHYLTYFEELKTTKEPFQFIVSRTMPNGEILFDTNMTVSMENYTIDETSKDVFDLTVTIKLKQYKEYGTKTIKVSNNVAAVEKKREQSNSPTPKQETTYTVQKDDCLWNIAQKIYGDGSLYLAIYEANKDKITQPYLIYPGQVLVIPSISDAKVTAKDALLSNIDKINEDPTNSSATVGSSFFKKMRFSVRSWGSHSSGKYYYSVIFTLDNLRQYKYFTEPFNLEVDHGTTVEIDVGCNRYNARFTVEFTVPDGVNFTQRNSQQITLTITENTTLGILTYEKKA